MVKRLFDIVCSICGLIILFPLFCLIAFAIKIDSKGPIFFRQDRVGLYGKNFSIHKFRTMVVNADFLGLSITVGKDSRITKVGYLLRKTKLDELPQLIDVLCGSMSLVGPRPEVPEYVSLYPQEIKDIIFSVRPGVTDWASIRMIDESEILSKSDNPIHTYINDIMPQKLAYAVKYVKNRSFREDIVIIFATFIKIITR